MANVCVITGGGSGMGLAAAKFMPKDKIIVISGRTLSKLEGAVNELKELGYNAYAKACDTSSRESVKELVNFALSLGEIKNVINSAGVSPAMKGTPEGILKINALGTVYINQEFSKVMKPGSVIVDVSSNSAYILPSFIIPKKVYPLAETNEEKFVSALIKRAKLAKELFLKFNVDKKIDFNVCDAVSFETEKHFDLIFIDAAKKKNSLFLDKFSKNLNEDGIIIVDNMNMDDFNQMAKEKKQIYYEKVNNEFKNYVFNSNKYDATLFDDIGDGIMVIKLINK
jgi:hypothetical protein